MSLIINSLPFLKQFSKRLDEFYSIKSKVVGKHPIHKIIREYAKHQHQIIDAMETLNLSELQALKKINQRIKYISQNKCTYYRNTSFGFIKRIYSCFLNAIYFGNWASSGSLGLTLSEKLAVQIENRENILRTVLL